MATKKSTTRKKTSAKPARKPTTAKKPKQAEKSNAPEDLAADQPLAADPGDEGERLLSQDEIDTLLFGMDADTDTNAAEPPPPPTDEIQRYDFTKQSAGISAVHLPRLDMLNEHFARRFRLGLFGLLRCSIDVHSEPYQATSFGDFLNNLPTPTSLNIVQARPLYGHTMFVLDANLVYTLVDLYFGGTGKIRQKVEGRDFTHTENRVVRAFLDQAFSDLAAVWKSITPLRFQHERSEQSPRFAAIYDPEEIVVQSTFSIDLEGNVNNFRVMFTVATLDPIKEALVSGYRDSVEDEDAAAPGLSLADLDEIPTEIVGEFSKLKLSVGDLLSLRAGDVLPLSSEPRPVLRAGNMVLGRGRVGTYKGNYALTLDEVESITSKSRLHGPAEKKN